MVVARHAQTRLRERHGLQKKAVDRTAERALQHGVRRENMAGRVRRYADMLWKRSITVHEKNAEVVLYRHNIYLFHGSYLITTWPLPPKLRHGRQPKYREEDEEVFDVG